jgi:glycerol uptake facilitator-like aquaporin
MSSSASCAERDPPIWYSGLGRDSHTFSSNIAARSGGGRQLFSEFIATFGLLSVIWGCGRLCAEAAFFAVGFYITGAYWFTASRSFANPAVRIRSINEMTGTAQ